MSIRLDTCMEALRSLARSSELEANGLPTAELRIRDFLTPVGREKFCHVRRSGSSGLPRSAEVAVFCTVKKMYSK
jgi:hypothetical protein